MAMVFKPGDVLLIEAGASSILGKVITKLTGSVVSHSALAISPSEILEMDLTGITKNKITDTNYFERGIHLRRHRTQNDLTKVLNIANAYHKEEIPYNLAGLILLGGVIVLREIFIDSKNKAIIDKILSTLCWLLDKLINEKMHGKNSHAMTCSQFVYQCFHDAGGKYRLIIKDGVLQQTPDKDGVVCLANLLANRPDLKPYKIQEYNDTNINEEALASELYNAISNQPETASPLSKDQLDDTLSRVKRFMELAEKMAEIKKIPLQALFAPADLLEHTENLI